MNAAEQCYAVYSDNMKGGSYKSKVIIKIVVMRIQFIFMVSEFIWQVLELHPFLALLALYNKWKYST